MTGASPVSCLERAPSATPPPRRRHVRAAAAALGWGIFLFVASQLILSRTLYSWRPALRDPEYGHKLSALKQQVAAKPGRPLVVVLGSSRVAMGFRPALLGQCAWPAGQEPVVLNFALLGAGPVMELMVLRRLLDDGVHPDYILVECWPPFWHQEGKYAEEERLDVNRLSSHDVALLMCYSRRPKVWQRACREAQLLPAYAHRFILMSQLAPGWIAWSNRRDDGWRGLDAWGWLERRRPPMTPAQHRQAVEGARAYYEPLCREFRFSPVADRALRDLLSLCRQARIPAALLLMPEAREFQSWYPPTMRAPLDEYLHQLSREHGVPILDARHWMGDAEFIDSFHLLPTSAAVFTERFGRELLRPLLQAGGLLSTAEDEKGESSLDTKRRPARVSEGP